MCNLYYNFNVNNKKGYGMTNQTVKIKDVYDIASAFIADKCSTLKVSKDNSGINYEFSKCVGSDACATEYTLTITMPCAGDVADINQDGKVKHDVDIKRGRISLSKGFKGNWFRSLLITAKTERDVSLADDKTCSDVSRAFTRMRSPRFFRLLNQAQQRAFGKLPTYDNTPQLFMLLYRLENANQR